MSQVVVKAPPAAIPAATPEELGQGEEAAPKATGPLASRLVDKVWKTRLDAYEEVVSYVPCILRTRGWEREVPRNPPRSTRFRVEYSPIIQNVHVLLYHPSPSAKCQENVPLCLFAVPSL